MTDPSAPRLTPLKWLSQQLRIDAVRNVFSMVEVHAGEVWLLVGFATLYAFLDGVGLSVLLPVLQYAEDGTVSLGGTSLIFTWPSYIARALGMPLNLVTLLMLAFVPVILRQIAMYLNAWYSALVSNRIAVRMRVGTYSNLMNADPEFFSRHSLGEFMGVVFSQTGTAGATVLQVMRLLAVVLQLVIYTTMLAFLSWPLTLMAAAAGWLVSQLVRGNMKRTNAFGRTVASITQTAYGSIAERIALARLVKMRAQEVPETSTVRVLSEQTAQANVSIAKLAAVIEVTADPLLMLAAFVTLYLGVAVLGLKLAALGMLLYVLTRMNGKVKEFNGVRQSISAGVAGMNLVKEMNAEAVAADSIQDGDAQFDGAREAIVLRDVSFAFPHAEGVTLKNIDATIAAGSFTALVGRSGAGKSTFVELIPRLRDASSGQVLIDGTDVRDFDLASLRRGIGYLTQEPLLFNDTVRMNLTYGLDRDVSEDQIVNALQRAHASFVMDLPEGLETNLGDRGVRFSGGERQRLAMARVLLDDPPVLILDEPTSALDSESERYIQESLATLHGSKTIIVIAHRLATVVAADQLFVLEDGAIVQQGVHDDLVTAEGPYKQLFESQLMRG